MSKIYCFTDIHGDYELWTAIKDFCQKDDKIIFLGDACDRGPDGIKIIQEMLSDKRVLYLKGNHEELLIESIDNILNGKEPYYGHLINGGVSTVKTLMTMRTQELRELELNLLKLPYFHIEKIEDIVYFFCHSGATMQNIKLALNGTPNTSDCYTWDRSHFSEDWINNKLGRVYCIHGHTPVPNLAYEYNLPVEIGEDEYPNILKYSREHKIDIDLGTPTTHKIALYCLTDRQVMYFYHKEEKKNV